VSSQFNWTLDFYGIQYGETLFDLNASETYVINHKNPYEGFKGSENIKEKREAPSEDWEEDLDDQSRIPTQNTIIKAHINPSSPFIALPNKLFKKIAELWEAQFNGLKDSYCSEYFCIVYSKCSEINQLDDFGIKLGTLNETQWDY